FAGKHTHSRNGAVSSACAGFPWASASGLGGRGMRSVSHIRCGVAGRRGPGQDGFANGSAGGAAQRSAAGERITGKQATATRAGGSGGSCERRAGIDDRIVDGESDKADERGPRFHVPAHDDGDGGFAGQAVSGSSASGRVLSKCFGATGP